MQFIIKTRVNASEDAAVCEGSSAIPMQKVSAIVPARWYIEVARKLLIQGVDVRFILKESVILFIQGMVLIGISWKMFKTRLE